MTMTNNGKLSILSTALLTKMDHKQVDLVVVALKGIDTNHSLAMCTVMVSAVEDHSE